MQNVQAITDVRIRAFRAVDDLESSLRYVEGHRRLLDVFGVKEVTSATNEWVYNPAVFAILVESLDGSKIYGGARVHAAGGNQPLPIEGATGKIDKNIYKMVEELSVNGTGELCGLWNSREVAGLGIGAYFATRAGAVISAMIGLDSMFALCASYTVKFAMKLGSTIVTELGKNGTFYYPKQDLLATVVLLRDAKILSKADAEDQVIMQNLRKNPRQVINEINPIRHNQINIHYELDIKNLNPLEFKKNILLL
jgi:hypothetical protein